MSVILQVVRDQLPGGRHRFDVKANDPGAVLLGALACCRGLLTIPDYVEFHPHAKHFIEIAEALMKGEPAPKQLIVPG